MDDLIRVKALSRPDSARLVINEDEEEELSEDIEDEKVPDEDGEDETVAEMGSWQEN